VRTAVLTFAGVLLAAGLAWAAYRLLAVDRQQARLAGEVAALRREQEQVRRTLDESQEALAAADDRTSQLMREDLAAVAGLRLAVAEYYQVKGRLPARAEDVGLPPPEQYRGRTLRSATLTPDGRIELVFDAASGVEGGRVVLVADTSHADATGVQWHCRTSDYPLIRRVSPTCEYVPPAPDGS